MNRLLIGSLASLGFVALCLGSARAAPGDVDASFGNAGIVTVSPTDPMFDMGAYGQAVVIQSDGKILVLGTEFGFPELAEFVLTRFNVNGSPDTSFANGGVATVSFGDFAKASALAIQSDGKIAVAGTAYSFSSPSTPNSVALARFTASGDLDPTFGNGGKTTVAIGTLGAVGGMVIQDGGQLLVAGTVLFNGTNSDFLLIRFNSSGGLDHCFGSTSCLNLSGAVHTDFGGQEHADAVMLQSDGKIVAAGCQGAFANDGRYVIARYSSNGFLDPTFGGDGRVVTDFAGTSTCPASMAQQADGKLIIAGSSADPVNIANSTPILVRYNTNGSVDTTFGNSGKLTTSSGEAASGILIQPDGRIAIAAGSTAINGNCCHFALARFNANGSVDTTFGINGVAKSGVFSDSQALALARQQVLLDGKIVLVGAASGDIAAARFEAYTLQLTRVGTFALAPAVFTASALQRFDYAFTWTVPDSENWHDLTSLQLRIRDGIGTILSARFDEASQTFSLWNAATGSYGPRVVTGSNQVLQTPDAALYMADARVVATGPTSPAVQLIIPLSLKPQTAGRSFVVEVAASDDFGNHSDFVQAGTLAVLPSK